MRALVILALLLGDGSSSRSSGAVLVRYDADGHAVPVDARDYQPYNVAAETR